MSAEANVTIMRRLDKVENSLQTLIGMMEDLTMTPGEYESYLDAERAHKKEEHRKWKTVDQLLKKLSR